MALSRKEEPEVKMLKWRVWLVILMLLSACGPASQAARPEPKVTAEMVAKRMEKHLSQPEWKFTLQLPGQGRFKGVQRGTDWTLKAVQQKETLTITKDGKAIQVVKGKNKETMDQRQFGLLAPKDHFQFIEGAAMRVEALPAQNIHETGIQVELNSDQVGKRLGKWMGEAFEKTGAANRAAQNFRVRYQLWYQAPDKLTRMKAQIVPLGGNGKKVEMVYTFQ
jgi:hypothetical protein